MSFSPPSHRPRLLKPRGFTILELLVAISVIAVLATLLLAAGNTMINRARRTQALNDAKNIRAAIEAFYSDYGRYPVPIAAQGNGMPEPFQTSVAALMNPLVGSMPAINPRNINYFTGQTSNGASAGFLPNGNYLDPWGNVYRVLLDLNFNGEVDDPYDDGVEVLPLKIGIYSAGRDGDYTTPDDNVQTWD